MLLPSYIFRSSNVAYVLSLKMVYRFGFRTMGELFEVLELCTEIKLGFILRYGFVIVKLT